MLILSVLAEVSPQARDAAEGDFVVVLIEPLIMEVDTRTFPKTNPSDTKVPDSTHFSGSSFVRVARDV